MSVSTAVRLRAAEASPVRMRRVPSRVLGLTVCLAVVEQLCFLSLAIGTRTTQVQNLHLLTDLNRRRGTTIVIVMHDLNLAARYAAHLIAMCDGRITQQGTPHEVITAETMREVFSMSATVINDPISNTPTIIPIGRHQCDGQPRGSRPDPHQSTGPSIAPADHELR